MIIRSISIITFCTVVFSLFITCAKVNTAGTASGGEGRVVAVRGQALLESGEPAQNIMARIRPATFLQGYDTVKNNDKTGEIYTTRTDDSGFYQFYITDTGMYRVEVTTLRDSAFLIDCNVGGSLPVDLEPQVLQKTGSISGEIRFFSTPVTESNVHILVYGVEHSARTNNLGSFSAPNLPEGVFKLRIENGENNIGLDVPGIEVNSGNQRNLGTISLSINGCNNYHCDSMVVVGILSESGIRNITVDSITTRDPVSKRITTLRLQEHAIATFPDGILSLSHLRELYLNDNQLISIPSDIDNLKSLRKLVLTNNRLQLLPSTLSSLDSLTVLMVNSNLLKGLPRLERCDSLRVLDLGNNLFDTFPQPIVSLTSLEELYINNNAVGTIPDAIAALGNLRILVAGSNELSHLPQQIGAMGSLRRLHVNSNHLTSIPPSIGSLENITTLLLNSNKLQTLPESITNLSKVIVLSLANNSLCEGLPESVIQWADGLDPDWAAKQVCQ